MKKANFISILTMAIFFATAISFSSCEQLLEKLATQEIPIDDLELDFDALVTGTEASALRGEALNSFSGTTVLKTDSTLFSDYAQYVTFVKGITLTEVKVEITSNEGTKATNVTLTSNALSASVTENEYLFGETYTADDEIKTLASNILNTVLENKDVDLTWGGSTDAPADTHVTLKLAVSGYLTVQLLDTETE